MLMLPFAYSYGQNPLYEGRNQFNIGVGLSEWGVPFYLGIDFSVSRDITMGGEISYRGYRENWKNSYYQHSILGFSGNGNYHFNSVLNLPSRFDFYAGLNLGFYVWNSPSGYDGTHGSGLGLGGQIGGRYYFSNTMGFNIEFGGGNAFSGGKIGISVKM